MINESERLLPCPFCGKQDAYVERYDYSSSYVVCDGEVEPGCACLARGPLAVQDADDEEIPGKEAAIRAWNTRAQSSGPVVAVISVDELNDLRKTIIETHGESSKDEVAIMQFGQFTYTLDDSAFTTGAAEVNDIYNTTSESYRDMIALWVGKLQHHENCAAAILPYPGGVIAFGKREDVVDMLKGDGDE